MSVQPRVRRRALRRSDGPRADRQSRAAGAAPSSTASSTACTARRTSARRSTSPSTAATSPGDDIRRVDWRLYARTDRYYVKQYEADTNTNFSVLLDVSKSMGFSEPRRLEARIRLATSPPASPTSRTGSATASASSRSTATSSTHVPPSAKHFDVVLHTLDRAKAERPGHLPRRSAKMAEHFKRRGILRADLRFLRRARTRCSRRSSRSGSSATT